MRIHLIRSTKIKITELGPVTEEPFICNNDNKDSLPEMTNTSS